MKWGVILIIDVTGVTLIPGNQGKNCPGNGENPAIECCCNECCYMLCCLNDADPNHCSICKDPNCPRAES